MSIPEDTLIFKEKLNTSFPFKDCNDNDIKIGGRPNTNGDANLYKDMLNELAVYDRALTADGVETVMNAKDILTVDVTGKLMTTWGALKTR